MTIAVTTSTDNMSENLQFQLPNMCDRHQSRLVRAAKYSRSDPWQSLVVCAQIALFQGLTVTPSAQKKLDGDLTRIGELGCLACRLPGRFDSILRTATKSRDLGEIKALGESWVKSAADSARKAE